MSFKALTLALLTTIVVLFSAATASAQSPADTVYNTDGGVLNVVSGGGGGDGPAPQADEATPVQRETATTPVASGDSLPFTGFEAGLVAMAGIALLGAGVMVRRLSRPEA